MENRSSGKKMFHVTGESFAEHLEKYYKIFQSLKINVTVIFNYLNIFNIYFMRHKKCSKNNKIQKSIVT